MDTETCGTRPTSPKLEGAVSTTEHGLAETHVLSCLGRGLGTSRTQGLVGLELFEAQPPAIAMCLLCPAAEAICHRTAGGWHSWHCPHSSQSQLVHCQRLYWHILRLP